MVVKTDSNKHHLVSQWVREHSDELYSWAFHKTSDEGAAQDLIQETFISAFQHFEKFQGSSSPKTWLFSILKNKIIDYYRLKAKGISLSNIDANQDETAQWFDGDSRWKKEFKPQAWDTENENLLDNPEFETALNNCMGKLPIAWSSCIQLKYLSEKDSADICQQLSITASNLWQILHRAKLHLRNCLEKNWFKA
jgi:RNA polymerase sigma-70 factor (ECF subfamily)